MIEKINQIKDLLIVPSVDEHPKLAINQMKILNLLVELRTEAEQCKNNVALADVSARLSSSLGECVEDNDYEIVADKDGRFWINHKEVGSGEPLEQWIDGVLNVR
jgi:hypothetical protein